jgi:hypothetical protein
MPKCIICNVLFSSDKGYNIHFSKLHKNNEINYNCSFCNKMLSCPKRKISHETTCKYKIIETQKSKIEEQKIETDKEIVSLKINLEQLKDENIKLKNELNSVTILKNHVLEQNDKFLKNMSTTINNNNNKITNNTFVLIQNMPSVKEEEIQEIISQLTYDDLVNGEEAIGTALSNKYLKKRVVCTDLSRNTLCWKEEDNEPVRDIQGKMIINKIKKAGKNEFNKFKVMLDTQNEQMDKTSPEEIIRFNNAWSTSEQLTSSLPFKNMSKVLAKNVPHKKQINITNNNITFISFSKFLSDYLTKKPVIIDKFYEGFPELFSYLANHYREEKCLYSSVKLIRLCYAKELYFFQENGYTFFIDDKGDIYEDEGHTIFINLCFSIIKNNKDCLPFYFSTEELNYINENDNKYAQHCIEETIKNL